MSNTTPTTTRADMTVSSEDMPEASDRFHKQDFASQAVKNRLRLPAKADAFFRRKYVFDRWVGSLLLVLTAPLTLVLFVLVKLTSPGPGFYRQTRAGLNGRTFEIIKLRSMVQDAEKPGEAVWCVKNDARVTWLGRILRKLHLDELPQLWNVAAGEMSLVGPRPERPTICEELAEQIDGYYQRVAVKPGITGLAQINLPPDETVEDAMRKQVLDLCYIKEANTWLDLRMLLATGLRMLGIKGETVIRAMRLSRRDLIRDRKFKASLRNFSQLFVEQEDAGWSDVESEEASLAFSMAFAKPSSPDTVSGPSSTSADPRRPR